MVQAEKARRNMERVLTVVAEGESSDTLIADRLGLDRSTVYRLRRKAAAEAVSVAAAGDDGCSGATGVPGSGDPAGRAMAGAAVHDADRRGAGRG